MNAIKYNAHINSNSIVHQQVTEHQEILDPNEEHKPGWILSDDERKVVCHGCRDESDLAKLQRQLDLLYGLNLSVRQHQVDTNVSS